MRTIKFRAWNGREMFNVDVLAISPCTWDCPDYGKRGVSLAYQPHIKVMQFTGLHDKNGKEIYEGDIVKTYSGEIGEIVFRNGMFQRKINNKWGQDLTYPVLIIGNIYENTELLEQTS